MLKERRSNKVPDAILIVAGMIVKSGIDRVGFHNQPIGEAFVACSSQTM
jgi:hypothetical protein